MALSLLSSLLLQVFSPFAIWSCKMGMRHVLLRKMHSSPRSVGRPLGTATMLGSRCSSLHTPVTLPAAACRSPVMGWKALREPVIKSQKIANSPAGKGRKEQGTAGVSRQGWVETTSQGEAVQAAVAKSRQHGELGICLVAGNEGPDGSRCFLTRPRLRRTGNFYMLSDGKKLAQVSTHSKILLPINLPGEQTFAVTRATFQSINPIVSLPCY